MPHRTILLTLAILALSWTCAAAETPAAAASRTAREPFLVSPAWLAEHLNEQSLVLLHVGDKESYDAAHIAGAQWVPYNEIGTRQEGALTLELPPVEQLQALFERLGVSDNSRIVLYMGTDWATPTARVFLTLEYLGLGERASILDGGLPAWRAEGHPVTTEVRTAAPGKLTVRPRNDVVVDAAWVSAHLRDASVAIVDARNTRFYEGDPGRMSRGGHIPGAKSVPFVTLLEESGKYKDAAALAEAFRAAGVPAGATVVTYCHIGQQASLAWFVARMLGYNARMYDGSFEDWSRRSELPVEAPTPSAPPPKD